MSRWIALLLMLGAPAAVHASAVAPSERFVLPAPAAAEILALPALDRSKLLGEDARKPRTGGPLRYALGHAVDAPVQAEGRTAPAVGRWTTLPDGSELWRLHIHAPGAVALDVGFDRFRLPHGAELWLLGERKHDRIGPITDAYNRPHGEFWSPRVRGERLTLELRVPAGRREHLQLSLATVHQAYRDVLAPEAFAKSGSCNVDVVCPERIGWEDPIDSVAVISFSANGSRAGNFCSGQFVNSTGAVADPLLLTANHCGITTSNDQTLVAYVKFENSTCRVPGSGASGSNGDGPLTLFVSGATHLASSAAGGGVVGSDFTLVRFGGLPPTDALYFTGWDRRDLAPAQAAGIHHPQGDEKRISFEFDPLAITGYLDPPGSGTTHLRVADWDVGTTEPGSSGSGLWNPDRRLVGVLSGGYAACGNELADWYGRLAHAWDAGATPERRLRDWLDPVGSSVEVLDGRRACDAPAVTLTSAAFSSAPAAGETVTFVATATGSGPFTYAWDLDGDGVVDRSSDSGQLRVSFPAATSTQVGVTVTGAGGCPGSVSHALDVRGPALTATAQAPQQLCGNNDASIDPGERWRVPVQLRNDGAVALSAGGRALFVPADAPATSSADAQGYTVAEDGTRGCDYAFVDIASGANAVAPLPTAVFDGNAFGALDDARTTTPVTLQPGLRIYDQPVTQAIVSTNGYISFAAGDTGGDYSNACDGGFDTDSVGPRLHVLHDDLRVGAGADDGIRHRYFASCPRPGDAPGPGGCHVFQWSGMQQYDAAGFAEGDFDFQALLYPGSNEIVYQYRSAAPDGGAGATVGLVASTAAAGVLDVACPGRGAAPATAASAVCIYSAGAQPVPAPFVIEQPAPAVAPAAGATGTVQVDIAVAPDAACGAPLAIEFLGAASATQSAPAAQRVLDARIGTAGACSASSCAAQLPAVDARYGLFFQAARPGNGLLHFVIDELDPDAYAGIWYTALADRTPAWYTVEGLHDGSLGRADLWQFTNPAAPTGFAPEGGVIGRGYVAQPSSDALVFAWAFDDGRRGIELLESIGLPFSTPNRTQLWYAPAEAGWGHGVESNRIGGGDNEFWATFLYDAQGIGRWVSGASPTPDAGIPLFAQSVHCPGCPYLADQLELALPAGTLTRAWAGPGSGILDTDIVLPPPLSGSWLRSDLPITTIGPIEPAAARAPAGE